MGKRNRRKGRGDAGYTLTELLVVLVILGLIAAAITPNVMNRLGSARTRAAALQAETLAASLDMFSIDVGRYPTTEEGLQALWTAPSGTPAWSGPYIRARSNLIDPWGRAYLYAPPGEGAPAQVRSFGADGAVGGDGADRDVSYPEL